MTFTFPALLWALPLAALPLALHVLARRRARRIPFGDLTLLRAASARALPRARLLEWLLAASRAALLALLVLAYAGPMLEPPGGGAKATAEGLDLVVLLDVSYSMAAREGGKSRFETAREAGASLLRQLGPTDRAAVAAFGERLENELVWEDGARAAARLSSFQTGSGATDYAAALAAATRHLAASPPGRRRAVVILSDGTRRGFRGQRPEPPPGTAWVGLEWGPLPNAWAASATPSADSTAAEPRLTLRAEGLSGPVPVELSLDGRRVPAGMLQGTGSQALTLALPTAAAREEPSWSGAARLQADALALDDAAYFSFRHPRRPRVLCLYGSPSFFKAPAGGYFLKEILSSSAESLIGFDADYLELSRASEARLSDYQAVLLIDFKDIPPATAAELSLYVRSGAGLWVVPGPRTEPESLAPLSSILPGSFGPLVWGEGAGLKTGPQTEEGLFKQFDLNAVSLGRYFLLQARPGARILFKSSTGYPLLVAGAAGAGRAALWAGALDASWGNLALKPVFAAWLEAGLSAVIAPEARRGEVLHAKVGEVLSWTWGPAEAAAVSVRLRAADGKTARLWPKDRRVSYSDTRTPGLYEMLEEGGSGRRRVFAVNLDLASGESDLSPDPSPPWTRAKPAELAAGLRRAALGREARAPVLALAAGFLFLEMVLALPRAAAAALALFVLLAVPAGAQQGDRLAWTQLKLGADWDPYPSAHAEILEFLSTVTSVLTHPERRVLSPRDPQLFFSPVVVLAGRQAPPPLAEDERRALRHYLGAGGFLWIEDVSGVPPGSFDRWVRESLPQILPDAELVALPADHVLFKTFFLLRGVGGRVSARATIEGVSWGGRTAVVYSRNDLLGIWVKDPLGQPLYPCVPGGEPQRQAGRKLALNILMYALTGSYKADAVHQPYLLQKLGAGAAPGAAP